MARMPTPGCGSKSLHGRQMLLMVRVIFAAFWKKDVKGHLCRARADPVLKSGVKQRAGRTLSRVGKSDVNET